MKRRRIEKLLFIRMSHSSVTAGRHSLCLKFKKKLLIVSIELIREQEDMPVINYFMQL